MNQKSKTETSIEKNISANRKKLKKLYLADDVIIIGDIFQSKIDTCQTAYVI